MKKERCGRSWNGFVCCCWPCSFSVAGISPRVVVNLVPQPGYEVERKSDRMNEEQLGREGERVVVTVVVKGKGRFKWLQTNAKERKESGRVRRDRSRQKKW